MKKVMHCLWQDTLVKLRKKDSDVLMLKKNLKSIGCTGKEDGENARKRLIQVQFSKGLAGIETELDDLQVEEMKIFVPSNIIDIWTILELLTGLKLSAHADTLTEASILIDHLYERGEKQNERQYQMALDKVSTN